MPKYDVFLSHNSADKPAVEELARQLVKAGIQPWLDTWNLIPGEPWQEAIEAALGKCATCAVFIGPSGSGPWQNEEMRAAIQWRVEEREDGERPFRVIPVLLPGAERLERSRLPTFLVATTWVEFRHSLDDEQTFHRLLSGIRGHEPGPGPGQAIYEGQNPYRGLQVFDVEHAPFFFGREALTEWLLNEIRPTPHTSLGQENRFLAIIGPSGSGKSSLARAGLIAALKQGAIKGSGDWPIAICRPGTDPLESLAVSLGDTVYSGQSPSEIRNLIKDLHNDERMLHLTTRLALRNTSQEFRVVVLVDQFEEIFTLCRDEGLRQALIDNLLYAVSVTGGQTVIILTLRADFYGKCAAYPTLAAALSDHQVLVGPMIDDELRRAIERPAQLVGCKFEAGLVETLLRDVQNQPGSLPLLQYALLELWRQRIGHKFTYAAYEAIGGVAGALAKRAEAIYTDLTPTWQEIARRILLRLIQLGEATEDTRRRVPLDELLPAIGSSGEVRIVVRQLVDARLLTTAREDNTEIVDVSHEALIRHWPRLRAWIDKERANLIIHRRLTEAVRDWEQNNRDQSYLYRGQRLAEANEWAKQYSSTMNAQERTFLETSQRVESKVKEQQEMTEKLKATDKLKTQFMANMSHELRTPLNSIIGFSRVILKGIDGPLTELQKADLTSIHNSGQHLWGLVNDILSLYQIEAGKMKFNFDEVEISPIIKGVMSTALALVKDKPVELVQKVPDELPTVWADPTRIRQVILELVSNACKFTDKGKVRLKAVASKEKIIISVSDTGIGIPEDRLDTIFEEFTQVDASTTRKVGGTGLGLAISRHFVEMHKGQIWVESTPGKGSTFSFAIPIKPVSEDSETIAEDSPETAEADEASKVIVVIDDNPGVITLYDRFLEKQNYKVVGVKPSEDIIDWVRAHAPFAILLDVQIPNQDGWKVLKNLKADPFTKDIPVIICTTASDKNRGLSLGAADYLTKPIVESELINALKH